MVVIVTFSDFLGRLTFAIQNIFQAECQTAVVNDTYMYRINFPIGSYQDVEYERLLKVYFQISEIGFTEDNFYEVILDIVTALLPNYLDFLETVLRNSDLC